jgi:hypothetical protein
VTDYPSPNGLAASAPDLIVHQFGLTLFLFALGLNPVAINEDK